MDTGAQITMMNPKILPEEEWTEHTKFFMAANGKIFKTELMTKKNIGIKFFPDCIIWTKVIGSNLPNKDIVIGMDVYSAADRLQILPRGIKFKRNFKAYTDTKKLFSLVQAPPGYHDIKTKLLKLCADNINPTKATHPGMSPSDYALAKEECNQLLRQGLIEPTKSEWACQAFYVEKRSEK
ncbi:polyprotein-like, partial [Trifolium medium]|nr:polyprotein-like [Trifolium medium]